MEIPLSSLLILFRRVDPALFAVPNRGPDTGHDWLVPTGQSPHCLSVYSPMRWPGSLFCTLSAPQAIEFAASIAGQSLFARTRLKQPEKVEHNVCAMRLPDGISFRFDRQD